jgi:hypothetical protein
MTCSSWCHPSRRRSSSASSRSRPRATRPWSRSRRRRPGISARIPRSTSSTSARSTARSRAAAPSSRSRPTASSSQGEPGGYFGLTFDKLERPKDTTWKLANGTIGDAQWREDIIAHFTRTPTPGSGATLDSGKLELERKFIPAQPEQVNTKVGLYTAEKLAVTMTGRVTLDHPQPDSKPAELPANWINQLWLVPNVGVIQVLNAYGHKYMLTDVQLK